MKLPKRTIHLVTLYLNYLKADLSDELKQAEVLRSLTYEEVEELLSLKSRLGAEDVSLIRQSLNDMREKGVYSVTQLALHGNELSGVAPALRQGVLNTLLEKVIRKEIKNRREDLLRYVEEMKKDA